MKMAQHMSSTRSLGFFVGLLVFLTACQLPAQNHVFSISGATGQTGSTFDATVTFDLVVPAQGWSFGVCHSPASLDLLAAVASPTTLTVNGGGAPGFITLSTSPMPGAGLTMGVIVDLFNANVLAAGMHDILVATYEMVGVADPDPIVTTLDFCNTLGTPAVDSVVVVDGGSLTPDFVSGVVTITPPPDYCLDMICDAGQTSVSITWSGCSSFDYFLLHRDGVLLQSFDSMTFSYDDLDLEAGTYHYALIGVVFPDPRGSPVILVAECDADVIPLVIETILPAVGPYTGGTLVTVTGTGFMNLLFPTIVEFDGVPQNMVDVISDTELTFVTKPVGVLQTVDMTISNQTSASLTDAFTYGFQRGEVNADGSVDIADGIFVLEYLFNFGAAPGCDDAADANDDGSIDIADGIYILAYLFDFGAPPPPPFLTAGSDPTGDSLGCL